MAVGARAVGEQPVGAADEADEAPPQRVADAVLAAVYRDALCATGPIPTQ